MQVKEIRCPKDPRRLFSKIILDLSQAHIVEGNLIEFSCQNCKRMLRDEGVSVARVLHRYNIVGELVETTQNVL